MAERRRRSSCYDLSHEYAIIAATFLLATPALPVKAVAGPQPSQAELRAAKALDGVRGDPLALNEFLKRMPKGGELHLHLKRRVRRDADPGRHRGQALS